MTNWGTEIRNMEYSGIKQDLQCKNLKRETVTRFSIVFEKYQKQNTITPYQACSQREANRFKYEPSAFTISFKTKIYFTLSAQNSRTWNMEFFVLAVVRMYDPEATSIETKS